MSFLSKIVEFFDVTAALAFDVKPEQAIAYFKAKGLRTTFSYADMRAQEHVKAFTVAKMLDIDLLKDVQDSLDMALSDGVPFGEWKKQIIPVLQAKGWWGKQDMVDPLTGQVKRVTTGTPHRLATIFRTNMQQSYSVGSWTQITKQAEDAPYLMYDAVDDFRTRPLHRSWDNTILPITDKWWRTHYPPNGFNCRCSAIQLDDNDLEQLGLGVDKPPRTNYEDWTNPRTGEVERIPEGIDPGFDYNPGQAHADYLDQILGEKARTLPADMQDAAQQGIEKAQQAAAAAAAQIQAEAKPKKLTKRQQYEALLQSAEDTLASNVSIGQSINLDGMREILDSVGEVIDRFGLAKLAYMGDPAKAPVPIRMSRRAMGGYAMLRDWLLFRNNLADAKYYQEHETLDVERAAKRGWAYPVKVLRERFRNEEAARIVEGLQGGWRWGVSNTPRGTMYHEMGHRMHALHKQEVDGIIRMGFNNGWSFLVSEYGCTNQAEFMAEAFALYMQGDETQYQRIYPPLLRWFKLKEVKK